MAASIGGSTFKSTVGRVIFVLYNEPFANKFGKFINYLLNVLSFHILNPVENITQAFD